MMKVETEDSLLEVDGYQGLTGLVDGLGWQRISFRWMNKDRNE